jgi:hypothetical protein
MKETLQQSESDFIQSYQSLAFLLYLAIDMSHKYTAEGMSPYQIYFGEFRACFTRLTESVKILHDSLYLALCGRYPSANALLRPALESITIGVFYTGLLDKTNRDLLSSLPSDKAFMEIVEEALEHPDCQTDSGILELTVSNRLRERKKKPPPYREILDMIIKWQLLKFPDRTESDEGLKVLYDDAYGPLSDVIHSRIDKTYFMSDEIQSLTDEELIPRILHGEKLVPEKLKNFFFHYNLIVDVVGYIFFSAIRRLFSQDEVSQTALEFLDKFKEHAEELKLTREIVRKFTIENSENI